MRFKAGSVELEWDGKYLKTYSGSKRLYEWRDNKYVQTYSGSKREYELRDNKYIQTYSGSKRIYEWDGSCWKDYSGGKKYSGFKGNMVEQMIQLLANYNLTLS